MRSRPRTDNTKVLPGQKNENVRVIHGAVLSVVTGLERACRQRLAPLLLSFTLSPLISNLPEVITAQGHICQQSVKPCREFKSCCRALSENWRKTAISSAQREKWKSGVLPLPYYHNSTCTGGAAQTGCTGWLPGVNVVV